MSGWNALRRFLARNAEFIRHGSRHDIYLFRGRTIQVSRGSSSMNKGMWRHILKNELGITQEEFNAGL